MLSGFCRKPVVWILVFCLSYVTCEGEVWNVSAEAPLLEELPALGEVTLHAGNLSAANSTSSVTCQIHTHAYNLTLSLTSDPAHDTSVTGRDVGVISILKIGQTEANWFLKSSLNFSVKVLIAVTELSDEDPLPGGCNIEFNLENDANVRLRYTSRLTVLSFQWALVAFPRGDPFPLYCLVKDQQKTLSYDIFVHYLPAGDITADTYFTAVKRILTQDSNADEQLGRKLTSLTYTDKSNVTVTSQPGQGALYTIRVTQKGRGNALYFPITSYSCALSDVGANSCDNVVKADVVAIVLTTIGGIVGLFLCFLGHHFLKTEMFVFGFLAAALVTYIPLFVVTDDSMACTLKNMTILLGVSAFAGVLGGAIWWLVWWGLGVPILSVFLCGLVGGFLFSSLMFFTPFGGLHYWKNDLNFGMCFTCAILILPIFLLIITRMLNILSCAFVGSFGIILAADTYLHSHMKYIILNAFSRFISPDFNSAIQVDPFSINEIILSVLWFLLFISGTVFQYVRERKRAPFPPCPRSQRRARAVFLRHTQTDDPDDERQPLLRNRETNQPNYGRASTVPFSPEVRVSAGQSS